MSLSILTIEAVCPNANGISSEEITSPTAKWVVLVIASVEDPAALLTNLIVSFTVGIINGAPLKIKDVALITLATVCVSKPDATTPNPATMPVVLATVKIVPKVKNE